MRWIKQNVLFTDARGRRGRIVSANIATRSRVTGRCSSTGLWRGKVAALKRKKYTCQLLVAAVAHSRMHHERIFPFSHGNTLGAWERGWRSSGTWIISTRELFGMGLKNPFPSTITQCCRVANWPSVRLCTRPKQCYRDHQTTMSPC